MEKEKAQNWQSGQLCSVCHSARKTQSGMKLQVAKSRVPKSPDTIYGY